MNLIQKLKEIFGKEKPKKDNELISNSVIYHKKENHDQQELELQKELDNLKEKFNFLINEKIELEKLLVDFEHQHSIELGDLLLEILKLRKLKYKNNSEKFKEAEQDEKQYKEHIDFEKENKVFELNEQEKKELKQNFRKASFLCHPDKVEEKYKKMAEEIFNELQEAYKINDLENVNRILNDLEKGDYFSRVSEIKKGKDKLIANIEEMIDKIENIKNIIKDIKNSESYKSIISIKNWNEYFMNKKLILEKELAALKAEIN